MCCGLRSALRAELQVLRDAYVVRINTFAEAQWDGSTSVIVPLDTMTDAYSQLLNRLGLLSPEEIRAVTQAYLLVMQMPERIRLLQHQHATSHELNSNFAKVGSTLFAALEEIHQSYLDKIEAAVTVLSASNR